MPVGKTKDAGWEIGASRTFPCTIDHAWRTLTSREGVRVWLGLDALPAEGDPRLRSLRPHDRIRLRLDVGELGHDSTVQVAVTASRGAPKTTVRFHQEHLRGPEEREAMRVRWHRVLDELAPALSTAR
jgi:hypothetical protein